MAVTIIVTFAIVAAVLVCFFLIVAHLGTSEPTIVYTFHFADELDHADVIDGSPLFPTWCEAESRGSVIAWYSSTVVSIDGTMLHISRDFHGVSVNRRAINATLGTHTLVVKV